MYRISVIVFLIGLAMGADKCGDQYASSFMCMMDLKSTDEVKLIMEKTKDACKECAPDYPKSCTEEWEAMESCCAELTAKAKLNDDPECAAIVNKTISDVDKCFETEPSDPLADLEMLIAPPMRMHTHEMMMKHMKKGGKSGMKEGGEKKSKEKAGGEKSKEKAGDEKSKEKAKSEDKSKNSTASGSGSSESEEEDDMPGFPHPPKSMHIRKECMKTPEQMKCLKKKLSEDLKDEKFQKAIETLLKKKDECEEKVKRECELTTPELGECFFTAHKDLFKKIFEKMETCVKGKTGGSSSDTKSEKKEEGKEGEKKDEKKEEKKDEKKDEKKEEKKDEKEEKKEEKGTETPKKGDRRRRR